MNLISTSHSSINLMWHFYAIRRALLLCEIVYQNISPSRALQWGTGNFSSQARQTFRTALYSKIGAIGGEEWCTSRGISVGIQGTLLESLVPPASPL
jgi:hypothetical protein